MARNPQQQAELPSDFLWPFDSARSEHPPTVANHASSSDRASVYTSAPSITPIFETSVGRVSLPAPSNQQTDDTVVTSAPSIAAIHRFEMERADLGMVRQAVPSRRVVDPGTLRSITPTAVIHVPQFDRLPTISLSERGSIMPREERPTLRIVPDLGTNRLLITLPPPGLAAAPLPTDIEPSLHPSYRPFPDRQKTDLSKHDGAKPPPLELVEPLIIRED